MKTQTLAPAKWRERCACRIRELDPQISQSEAETVAEDVYDFERTRAMPPEDAAAFVAEQMSRTEPPRFERRSKERSENAPFIRSILRYLSPAKNAS